MKHIKTIKVDYESKMTIYSEHSIYELTKDEMDSIGIHQKYLVNRTYSKYAMHEMDMSYILKNALRDSEYVYGVKFADTIEEAELKYQNDVLQCRIMHLQDKIKDISEKCQDLVEMACQDISFTTSNVEG